MIVVYCDACGGRGVHMNKDAAVLMEKVDLCITCRRAIEAIIKGGWKGRPGGESQDQKQVSAQEDEKAI